MELFLQLVQIPLLIILINYIGKKHFDPLLRNSYYYLVSVKVTAGIIMGILYFNYYKAGDTTLYLKDLDQLSSLFHVNINEYIRLILFNKVPSSFEQNLLFDYDPRAFVFVRLISPVYLLTGNNYWLLSIYMSLFSFVGFWLLSATLIRYYKVNSLAILVSFFLFPSVVFWTAGVLKESFTVGAITFILHITLTILNGDNKLRVLKITVALLFAVLLLEIKFYYFAALFVVLLPYVVIKTVSGKVSVLQQRIVRILVLLLLIPLFGFIVSLSNPLLDLNKISQTVYYNYKATLRLSEGDNCYTFEGLSGELVSFIPHIPKAIVYGLFGPFLWHCKKLIALISGIESTILLVLLGVFALNSKKSRKIDIEEVSLLLYVLILAMFMAFASPNWGSLVRYKVAYLPFFLLLLLNSNPLMNYFSTRLDFLNKDKKPS